MKFFNIPHIITVLNYEHLNLLEYNHEIYLKSSLKL